MLLELYITFLIIAFISFFLALYLNKGVYNLFVWPVSIVIFVSLFFASYNISYNGVTYIESAFSWLLIGMAVLGFVLFGWNIWDKYNAGEF